MNTRLIYYIDEHEDHLNLEVEIASSSVMSNEN